MAFTMLLSSCVSDDSLFPDTNEETITTSVSLVSILNDLTSRTSPLPENELCFRFKYPIVLGYNTDSSIRLDTYDGLVDVISSQSSNFNISGAVFPVDIEFNKNDSVATIRNEADFIRNIGFCGINTFREDFDRLFRKCIKFEYPVTLLDRDKEEVRIANEDGFDVFYQEQGIDYQPDFKFPINVLVAPDFVTTNISSYFEFYELINDCAECPNAEFTKELIESPATYRFISNIEQSDAVFFWFINNELVGDVGRRVFEYDFLAVLDGSVPGGPGSYEICLKVETPDCPEGIKFCKEIIVQPVCPDLRFEFTQEPGTFSYNFIADFVGINEIMYNWIVDDQVVEDNDGGVAGDNMFVFQFTPGIHNVCIRTETPLCPQGKEFCKEIIVCPELFFAAEQQGNTNTYDFFAEFLGMESVTYQWTINNEPQESDGGAGGDNTFVFQFEPGASYEVCILAEIPGCTDGTKFCVPIEIP